MNKYTLILTLLLVVSKLSAQPTTIENRFQIRMGYSPYEWLGYGSGDKKFSPVIHSELSYSLTHFVSTAIYLGHANYETHSTHNNHQIRDLSNNQRNALLYGASINLHALSLLNKRIEWIDLFLSSKIGMIHYCKKDGDNFPNQTAMYIDYGVFFVLAVYPINHFGMFAEYGYGNKTQARLGICWKF